MLWTSARCARSGSSGHRSAETSAPLSTKTPTSSSLPTSRSYSSSTKPTATTRARRTRSLMTSTTAATAAAEAAASAATTSEAFAEAAKALSRGPNPPLPTELSRWVRRCNAPAGTFRSFVTWKIDGVDVGLVRPGFAEELRAFPEVFSFVAIDNGDDKDEPSSPSSPRASPSPSSPNHYVTFNPRHSTPRDRTGALATAMSSLKERGIVKGWRDELFPVSRSFGEEPFCLIERAAAVHMGIRAYGIHLNGFVSLSSGDEKEGGGGGASGGASDAGDDNNETSSATSSSTHHRPTHLWVATRSATKPTWPGRLDHLVAGGQPASLSIFENVVKECAEEAGVPESLVVARARPAGVVSYSSLSEDEQGCKRDVLFVFDLELPSDFVPKPCDGEVERFDLLPLEAAAALVARTDRFKDNCNLVLADFFVRHGVVRPDDEGYLELVAGLRPGLGEFA